MAANEVQPKILIIGGTGFIGRNLVHYLVTNNLASKVDHEDTLQFHQDRQKIINPQPIRVADKVLPHMAWMNPVHKDAFASPLVEFKHANLINQVSVASVFTDDSGSFDFVVNLAAETKYGQSDDVYKDGIVKLSMNCAREAERHHVKFYLEMSSGQMYSSNKTMAINMAISIPPITHLKKFNRSEAKPVPQKPAKEDTKCEPWTHMAKHKLEVEHQLSGLRDLRYAVIRPGIVYGLGDRNGLTPRIIIGAIYKYTQQKMKILWTKYLIMNTVHVHDLCRAIYHLFTHAISGEVYNCVDKGNTTQGLINDLVSQMFDISYEFLGSTKSNLARVNMTNVVEDINEKHMAPWVEACARDAITNTPLNPFIDQELLYNKHLHLDGTKLDQTGFTYSMPHLEVTYLNQVLDDYVQMKLFPKSLLYEKTALKDVMFDDDLGTGLTNELPDVENLQLHDAQAS